MSGIFKRNNSSNDVVMSTKVTGPALPKRVWQPTLNELRDSAKRVPTTVYRYFNLNQPQTTNLDEVATTTSDHHDVRLDLILTSRDTFTQKLVQKTVNFGHATKQTLNEYNQMFEQIYKTKRFNTADEQLRIKEQMTTVIKEFGKSYDYINDIFIRLVLKLGLPDAYYDFGLHSLFGTKFFEQNKVSVILYLCSQEFETYVRPNYLKTVLKIIQTMSDKQKFDLDTMKVIDNPSKLEEDGVDVEGSSVTSSVLSLNPSISSTLSVDPSISSTSDLPELVQDTSTVPDIPTDPAFNMLSSKILGAIGPILKNESINGSKITKLVRTFKDFKSRFRTLFKAFGGTSEQSNTDEKIYALLNSVRYAISDLLLDRTLSKYTVSEFQQMVPGFRFSSPDSTTESESELGSGLRKRVLGRPLRSMRNRKY
jgi:hypothetical protein